MTPTAWATAQASCEVCPGSQHLICTMCFSLCVHAPAWWHACWVGRPASLLCAFWCQHGVTPVASVCVPALCVQCAAPGTCVQCTALLNAVAVGLCCCCAAWFFAGVFSAGSHPQSTWAGRFPTSMSQIQLHGYQHCCGTWPLLCDCNCLQQAASIEAATSCTEDGCNSCRVCMLAGMVTLLGGLGLTFTGSSAGALIRVMSAPQNCIS